ncbi:hypothetical protein F5Y11DRAFT_364642 [Daldinia sp. FL1419]|nr:hypothetical protein F5Y11DRAFT_364642 [Daldinia sp. FL1419]
MSMGYRRADEVFKIIDAEMNQSQDLAKHLERMKQLKVEMVRVEAIVSTAKQIAEDAENIVKGKKTVEDINLEKAKQDDDWKRIACVQIFNTEKAARILTTSSVATTKLLSRIGNRSNEVDRYSDLTLPELMLELGKRGFDDQFFPGGIEDSEKIGLARAILRMGDVLYLGGAPSRPSRSVSHPKTPAKRPKESTPPGPSTRRTYQVETGSPLNMPQLSGKGKAANVPNPSTTPAAPPPPTLFTFNVGTNLNPNSPAPPPKKLFTFNAGTNRNPNPPSGLSLPHSQPGTVSGQQATESPQTAYHRSSQGQSSQNSQSE